MVEDMTRYKKKLIAILEYEKEYLGKSRSQASDIARITIISMHLTT